jgi:hypothetical protein
VFNVGDTAHNYQVREIAQAVADVFPDCKLSFGDSTGDNRSYRVSFEKINERLPGFSCDWDAAKGARQLHEVFERIGMTEELFESRGFTRLKQLEHLVGTGQIDETFRWAAP